MLDAMIDAVEVLRAQEALELGHTVALAVSAALAMTGAAGSKKAADSAITRYNQWMAGKRAVIDGTVGFEVDEHGASILRSASDIRRWFMDKGQIKV